MSYSRFFFAILALTLALFLAGCSGRPVDQIDRTEKAKAAAAAEAALEFAPNDWKEGEDDWAVASRALEQEKWGEASTALLKAKAHYDKARDIAQGLRAAAVKEINGTSETARIRLDALKKDLETGAKKIPAAKLKTFQEAMKVAEDKLASAPTKMSEGHYQDAKLAAGQSLREIWDIQKEVDQALGKKSK